MDAEQAVSEGEKYLRNAEDALDRDVSSEEELYIWENQVEVIDAFLADTEDIDGGEELADLRQELRDVKKDLEKQTIAFLEGDAPDEIVPPEEQLVQEVQLFVEEFLPDVDETLEIDPADVENVHVWETPLTTINSILADSEPYRDNPELEELREELKIRKAALEERIEEVAARLKAAEVEAD